MQLTLGGSRRGEHKRRRARKLTGLDGGALEETGSSAEDTRGVHLEDGTTRAVARRMGREGERRVYSGKSIETAVAR